MSNLESNAYQLSDLQYHYEGQQVLDIKDLTIKKNCITSLIGSNGSGKTTLLNLLAFLDKPSAGELMFFAEKTVKKSPVKLRRRVAMVSQNPYLLRGSVFDNILLGLRLHGLSKQQQIRQAEQAMDMVGIAEFAKRNVKKLSGGEAQKVTLARALALKPEVLLLDEPFSYLDKKSTERLSVLIKNLTQDRDCTVIFSTHDQLHGTAVADQGISLLAGRPVSASLLNMFQGEVAENSFSTELLNIFVPQDIKTGNYLVVDPVDIALSTDPLVSSIRNNFKGNIRSISEEKGRVWITVEAKEKFIVQITRESLSEMGLTIGSEIWVNFKSTSVKILD